MATASTIKLEASQRPEFYVDGITEESARLASKLLQENHEKHHIFFNQSGFHNHIVHHLLTLFALRATPSEIQKAYDDNASYQRAPVPLEKSIVNDMHDPAKFKTYLGNEKYYHDFLVFFQGEIEKKGWETVLQEYVFSGSENSDDMLVRMFSGFLHPIIHLGFGVEFKQPAIIAEALAQAAVHDNWIGELFFAAEKAARARGPGQDSKSLVQLLDEIRADKKLSGAAHWEDANKIRDGILKRAPEEMVRIASQYVVREEDLEEKTAEMINAAVYFTACAQHPPSQVKFDFFYIHCTNSSIFFSTFLTLPFLAPATKARLLEWKGRLDLAMYVSRGSPPLDTAHITTYRSPTSSTSAEWKDIIDRVNKFPDDGHASKFIRALAHGEQVCKKFENGEGFRIKNGMWKTLGEMAIDSVEAGGPTWVRNTGFEEAWKNVPERESARL